jgi:hypothetical protein
MSDELKNNPTDVELIALDKAGRDLSDGMIGAIISYKEAIIDLQSRLAAAEKERDAWKDRAEKMKLGNECFERERDIALKELQELREKIHQMTRIPGKPL